MYHNYSRDDLKHVERCEILYKYYSISEEGLEHGVAWHPRVLEPNFIYAGGMAIPAWH